MATPAPPPSAAPAGPPPWPVEGARAILAELRAYLALAWAFARHPARTARGWSAGEAPLPNPLAMMATGAALVAAVQQVAFAVLGLPSPEGLVAVALSALGPYAHYLAIGALCHLVLRRRGGGLPLRGSLGLALYVGAGPAMLAQALAWTVVVAASALHGAATGLIIVAFAAAFAAFCASLSACLAACHRASFWRMSFALLLALVGTGLVFGEVRPPGTFGLHWVLRVSGGVRMGLTL